MKGIKLLGIAVGTLGVAASVGGAVALYTKAAQDTGFGIGAGSYVGSTGIVNYLINGNASGSIAPKYLNTNGEEVAGAAGLSDASPEMKYTFPLSATYASDVPTQTYTMGKVTVTIGDVPAALLGNFQASIYVTGYNDASYGINHFKEIQYDYDFTTEAKSLNRSNSISITSAGGQSVEVYLKIKNKSLIETLDQDELALPSVSLTWGKLDDNYGRAYVVGNYTQWGEDDEFAMAVDHTQANWNWRYDNLPGTFAAAKVKKGDTWSAGEDAQLDSAKTYTVTWDETNAAVFTANP